MREAARTRFEDLRTPLAPIVGRQADAGSVRALIDQVAGHNDALQQVVAQACQADTLAEESARHSQAALVDDEESVAFARQRTETEGRRTAAEQARDAGRAALAEMPVLAARHKSLSRVQQVLGDQERSAGNLETLERQADSADRLLLDARKRLLDLRERRLAGMAAELANDLAAGDACPVCGSCSHPMPAQTTDVVSPEDVRSAEADQTRATEALGLVRSTLCAESARRDARVLELAAAGPTMVATDVADALAASTAAIADARTAGSAVPEAEAQMVALALDVERLRGLAEAAIAAKASSLALASSARVQSQTAGAEVTRLLANHDQTCPCHRGNRELTAVAELSSRHRQTLAHLRLLATGIDELVTHEANVCAALVRLSTTLQDHGFETMEQAKDAALPPARVAELTRTCGPSSSNTRRQPRCWPSLM
jgi:exonuclease SbcC